MESVYSYFFNQKDGDLYYFSAPSHALLFYEDRCEDLLTGKISPLKWENLKSRLQEKSLFGPLEKGVRVIHAFYELCFFLHQISEKIGGPLLLEIEYEEVIRRSLFSGGKKKLAAVFRDPELETYRERFLLARKEIIEGKTYQLNLTDMKSFSPENCKEFQKFEETVRETFFAKENRENLGAYAHSTTLRSKDAFLLSNSPESLFSAKFTEGEIRLEARPLKGTAPQAWGREWLLGSEKNQNELDMITDLWRNDLERLAPELPSVRVRQKKGILSVPGLFHLYSLIEKKLASDISFYQVLLSLFPSGSVTGAPKKSSLAILKNLEKRERGFYCGSTFLCTNRRLTSSVNIRSGEYWNSLFQYGAGGGLTISSRVEEEYAEMLEKFKSFEKLLF